MNFDLDTMNKHRYINTFARHMLFDTADREYLMARLAFKNGLYQQFYWSSLHSIEKYLKSILIFNRVSSKRFSHDIGKINDEVVKIGIDFLVGEEEKEFFDRVSILGQNRYLDKSWWILGSELNLLDNMVFRVRHYCYDIRGFYTESPLSDEKFKENVFEIEKNLGKRPLASEGLLEKVIKDESSPQREALSWMNSAFLLSDRHIEKFTLPFFENTPLFYLQEKKDLYYGDLEKLIKLPGSK